MAAAAAVAACCNPPADIQELLIPAMIIRNSRGSYLGTQTAAGGWMDGKSHRDV